MRRGSIAFAAVFVTGLAGLVALVLTNGSSLVYSIGVVPATTVAQLGNGDRACQRPILLPAGTSFDRVAFTLDTGSRPGPPVAVEIRDDRTGRSLASGRLSEGYGHADRVAGHVVAVGTVRAGTPLRICLVNRGRSHVAVLGQAGVASPRTSATLEGQPLDTDIAVALHDDERSLLALLPDMAERAGRFRAGWVTPAVYAVLGLLLLVGAPLLLARGLARAQAQDGG